MQQLPVSNEQVAQYRDFVAGIARSFVGDAEFDDLEQIGLIRVWRLLERGQPILRVSIANAMKDELRRARRRGVTGYPDDGIEYVDLADVCVTFDGEVYAVDAAHV